MRRAWSALNCAAHDAGEKPLAPEVWECVLPSTGEVVSLVRTETEAHHVARECRVFTVAEVAILIEALGDGVLAVKHSFPAQPSPASAASPQSTGSVGTKFRFEQRGNAMTVQRKPSARPARPARADPAKPGDAGQLRQRTKPSPP